jgi:hypothetical protein
MKSATRSRLSFSEQRGSELMPLTDLRTSRIAHLRLGVLGKNDTQRKGFELFIILIIMMHFTKDIDFLVWISDKRKCDRRIVLFPPEYL